jgi:hypothetical protein
MDLTWPLSIFREEEIMEYPDITNLESIVGYTQHPCLTLVRWVFATTMMILFPNCPMSIGIYGYYK